MSSATTRPTAPDQGERERALDASRSILVQAPAGSGKTDLLTRRFLRLLAEVDDPAQIVAITFTNAAAAEMRHRILGELEQAAASFVSGRDFRDHTNPNITGLVSGHDFSRAENAKDKTWALAPEGQPPASHDAISLSTDALSMASLAARALACSHARGWNLLDLPAQLRISTIDAFCRDLALQQPLLSGLGGGLDIAEQPRDL